MIRERPAWMIRNTDTGDHENRMLPNVVLQSLKRKGGKGSVCHRGRLGWWEMIGGQQRKMVLRNAH